MNKFRLITVLFASVFIYSSGMARAVEVMDLTVELEKSPIGLDKARLYISGLGYYRAYLNGDQVGDRVLAPSDSNMHLNTDEEKARTARWDEILVHQGESPGLRGQFGQVHILLYPILIHENN